MWYILSEGPPHPLLREEACALSEDPLVDNVGNWVETWWFSGVWSSPAMQ